MLEFLLIYMIVVFGFIMGILIVEDIIAAKLDKKNKQDKSE